VPALFLYIYDNTRFYPTKGILKGGRSLNIVCFY